MIKIKWYGYDDVITNEPLDNVLDGAHLLLYAYIKNHESDLDPIIIKEITKEIYAKCDTVNIEQKSKK